MLQNAGTGQSVIGKIIFKMISNQNENHALTRNVLDCDQSNYSSRIIFSCRLFLQAAL